MFSYENLDNIAASYDKLVRKIAELGNDGEINQAVFTEYKNRFIDAICGDVNTSMALTVVYDMLKADTNDKTKRALAEDFDRVLSLNLMTAGEAGKNAAPKADEELVSYIEAKIEERKEAKKAKDFAKADAIRDELLSKGVAIKDTREGVVWELV